MPRESRYQAGLIKRLNAMFPGCYITKQDSGRTQGIPDLLILFKKRWAMLEVKADEDSPSQPNQDYYVNHFNGMSFAAYIHPGNEEQVLSDLQKAFGARR